MILLDQYVSSAFCEPHEDHLLYLTDTLASLGIEPHRWLGNWFHTHPRGMGPTPSGTDHTTFNSTRFSRANHSFMAILGGNDEISCRFRLLPANPAFPPLIHDIKVKTHFSFLPERLPRSEWTALYTALTYTTRPSSITYSPSPSDTDALGYSAWISKSLSTFAPDLAPIHNYLQSADRFRGKYAADDAAKIVFNPSLPTPTLMDLVIEHFTPGRHFVEFYAHLPSYHLFFFDPSHNHDAILTLPYIIPGDRARVLQNTRTYINEKIPKTARTAAIKDYLDYLETAASFSTTGDLIPPPPIPEPLLLTIPSPSNPPTQLWVPPTPRATPIPPTDRSFWE